MCHIFDCFTTAAKNHIHIILAYAKARDFISFAQFWWNRRVLRWAWSLTCSQNDGGWGNKRETSCIYIRAARTKGQRMESFLSLLTWRIYYAQSSRKTSCETVVDICPIKGLLTFKEFLFISSSSSTWWSCVLKKNFQFLLLTIEAIHRMSDD